VVDNPSENDSQRDGTMCLLRIARMPNFKDLIQVVGLDAYIIPVTISRCYLNQSHDFNDAFFLQRQYEHGVRHTPLRMLMLVLGILQFTIHCQVVIVTQFFCCILGIGACYCLRKIFLVSIAEWAGSERLNCIVDLHRWVVDKWVKTTFFKKR